LPEGGGSFGKSVDGHWRLLIISDIGGQF
jgi:hypothetical protein